MGLAHKADLSLPTDTMRLFWIRTFAPRDRIPSRGQWTSSHSEAPSIIVSPRESRDASSALCVYALEPGAVTVPRNDCGPLILTIKALHTLSSSSARSRSCVRRISRMPRVLFSSIFLQPRLRLRALCRRVLRLVRQPRLRRALGGDLLPEQQRVRAH